MAKQTINVGQTANDKKGDSLRAAFQKVNSNFTELYTQLGLVNDPTLNLGAFEFTGSTMSTTDSSSIVIDQATIISSDLTVGGDILPSVAQGGNLGSPTRPFRSLYVSNSTVYLGGVPLSLEPGTNELRVNNIPISQNITYTDIPNAPTDISELTDNTGLLGGGGPGLGNYSFDGDILQADQATIKTNDGDLTIESDSDVFVKSSAGEKEWQFGVDGSLKFPGTSDYRISESFGGGSLAITSEGNINIFTNSIESFKLWTFNTNGNLELPEGGEIRFSYGYIDQDENINGNALRISGGNSVVINADEDGKTWEFSSNGALRLPSGGDILNSSGQSVLGGGTPSIPNTIKGFINLVGDRPNNDDDAWFESVVVRGNYAYVLGSDYYIDNSNDNAKIYKFDIRTGEQVWVKQITAGRGATFAITIGGGTITINGITQVGTGYKVGEEIPFEGYEIGGGWNNNFIIIVNSIDGSGGIVTASVKPGYDVGILTYNSTISSFYDDIQGDVCAIAYDDFNDKLIVTTEYSTGRGDAQDNFWTWANVYFINPLTGVIEETVTLSDEGDIFPNSIATLEVDGGIAIVGEKYNEYREFGLLSILNGLDGYFYILKSEIDAEHYPGSPYDNYSDFWVTGTGINGQNNVDGVNQYTSLATTVRQGSGAEFQVVSAGDGLAYVSALATVPNKGTNYLVGHKIKILGTALGGATPANDAIIEVTEIGAGGSIEAVSISGTGGDVGGGTYNNVTGTNYQTGSGAQISVYINPADGSFSYNGINDPGSNYVAGDVLTIAGSLFGGGTSPANDATLTIFSVGGGGGINSITGGTISGTGPTNVLKIRVDGVDFSAPGGSWSMRQNLGGEAFVWTPTWTNAIGGGNSDRFYDVTWSADGTALYAVGRGRYETNYDQALVVKFDATDGSIVWSKDIKFTEATTVNRQARAVCLVPNSTDIMVGGEWYGGESSEIILTRITAAGTAVWQKTYAMEAQGVAEWVDPEISLKPLGNNIVVSFEQGTNNNNSGLAYMIINPDNGTVIRHRVFSSDGNGNRVYYNTPTANFTDIYSDATGDYVVMAGYTYVPTDNYYNSLLMKLPLDGLVNIDIDERWNIGEHIMNRHTVNVTTVTPAFESFTADQHIDTITNTVDARNYVTRAPDGELKVWTYTITDDSAGYLEFGDGSKQSFATNVIPQIPAANDYYLTEQDSGKHIFYEHENGWVYIPHWQLKTLPVGFTFTLVNTTGSDCYIQCQSGPSNRGRLKLAGRNIETYVIGIPDSGSGSMVTFLKIKEGYIMSASDNDADYPDVWIVSGPGDIYDND